jgi:hypothetical protein
MDEREIRLLVESLLQAWNERDIGLFVSLLDEEVVWNDPAMLYGPVKGRSAVREFSNSVLVAFPDFTYRIREPICFSPSGDLCVVPWEIIATHTGRLDPPGFSPTNQTIRAQGVDVIEIRESKITRIDTLFNVLPAIEQVLRLKPIPQRGFKKSSIVMLQRLWASWLRYSTRNKDN